MVGRGSGMWQGPPQPCETWGCATKLAPSIVSDFIPHCYSHPACRALPAATKPSSACPRSWTPSGRQGVEVGCKQGCIIRQTTMHAPSVNAHKPGAAPLLVVLQGEGACAGRSRRRPGSAARAHRCCAGRPGAGAAREAGAAAAPRGDGAHRQCLLQGRLLQGCSKAPSWWRLSVPCCLLPPALSRIASLRCPPPSATAVSTLSCRPHRSASWPRHRRTSRPPPTHLCAPPPRPPPGSP